MVFEGETSSGKSRFASRTGRTLSATLTLLAAAIGLTCTPPPGPASPDAAAAPIEAAALADEMERVLNKQLNALKDKAFAESMGFWMARMALLDRVEREAPDLAEQARSARQATVAAFEPGFIALRDAFVARNEDNDERLAEIRAQSLKTAAEQDIASKEFADAVAAGGLEPRRAPWSSASLLLSLNPRYRAKPCASIDDGFAAEVPVRDDAGHTVARVRMPMTFAANGEQKPGSMNLAWGGFAPAVLTITVAKNVAGLDAGDAAASIVGSLPTNARTRPDAARDLRTPLGNGAIVGYEVEIENRKVRALGRTTYLVVPSGDWIIGIAATVFASEGDGQRERLDELEKRFEALFEGVFAGLAPVEQPRRP